MFWRNPFARVSSEVAGRTADPQERNRLWWERLPMTYAPWEAEERLPRRGSDFERIERLFLEGNPWIRDGFDFGRFRGKDVLDLGCGTGVAACLFARAGARVVAADLTETGVRMARANAESRGLPVRVLRTDAEALGLRDASVDHVFSWGVLHLSRDTARGLREVARVLRPGGTALVMVYNLRSVRYWLYGLGCLLFGGKIFQGHSLRSVQAFYTDGFYQRHYTPRGFRALAASAGLATRRIVLTHIPRPLLPGLPAPVDRWCKKRLGWILVAELEKPARDANRGGVLFLYSVLPGYMLASARAYAEATGTPVHVVTGKMQEEAPYQHGTAPGVVLHEREGLDTEGLCELVDSLAPRAIYVSGWRDRAYRAVAHRSRKRGIPVILAGDTWWKGLPRQRLLVAASRLVLHPCYSHIWVPGLPQYEYARRLGFPRERILTGMYCADEGRFHAAREAQRERRASRYPHRFLYVGRLVDIKGVRELCEAFVESCREEPHDWTLRIVGAGELAKELPAHPRIEVRGFVQPRDLPALAAESGAFVLPSREEPWGVVLHEFAAAGLPLVASTACGAATAFLRDGYNGFPHRPGDTRSLRDALLRVVRSSDAELRRMGERSAELARQITIDSWVAALRSVAEGGAGPVP